MKEKKNFLKFMDEKQIYPIIISNQPAIKEYNSTKFRIHCRLRIETSK